MSVKEGSSLGYIRLACNTSPSRQQRRGRMEGGAERGVMQVLSSETNTVAEGNVDWSQASGLSGTSYSKVGGAKRSGGSTTIT